MKDRFDLFDTIIQSIERNEEQILDNDIIVISSKFVAMSQGSVVELNTVKPSERAVKIAEKFNMDPRLVELILQESDYIFNGIEGFILAVKDGVMAPNAGIDKSNIPQGFVILHPRDAFNVAQKLRKKFLTDMGKKVGIVITDSRLMPLRIGTVGIAVGVAGFEPVEDLRGKKDLFGNTLKVTLKATADSLATAANIIMGESNETIPLVIVRNFNVIMSDRVFSWKDLAISSDRCIYVRGLREQ
jgi:coenzyme F420-0:L-glutamate ligase